MTAVLLLTSFNAEAESEVVMCDLNSSWQRHARRSRESQHQTTTAHLMPETLSCLFMKCSWSCKIWSLLFTSGSRKCCLLSKERLAHTSVVTLKPKINSCNSIALVLSRSSAPGRLQEIHAEKFHENITTLRNVFVPSGCWFWRSVTWRRASLSCSPGR